MQTASYYNATELFLRANFDFIDGIPPVTREESEYIRGYYITDDEIWVFDVNNDGRYGCDPYVEVQLANDQSYSYFLYPRTWRTMRESFYIRLDTYEKYCARQRGESDIDGTPNTPSPRRPSGAQNVLIIQKDALVDDPHHRNSSPVEIIKKYQEYIWGPGYVAKEVDEKSARDAHARCYNMAQTVGTVAEIRAAQRQKVKLVNSANKRGGTEQTRVANAKENVRTIGEEITNWFKENSTEDAEGRFHTKAAFEQFVHSMNATGRPYMKSVRGFATDVKSVAGSLGLVWAKQMSIESSNLSGFKGRRLRSGVLSF